MSHTSVVGSVNRDFVLTVKDLPRPDGTPEQSRLPGPAPLARSARGYRPPVSTSRSAPASSANSGNPLQLRGPNRLPAADDARDLSEIVAPSR